MKGWRSWSSEMEHTSMEYGYEIGLTCGESSSVQGFLMRHRYSNFACGCCATTRLPDSCRGKWRKGNCMSEPIKLDRVERCDCAGKRNGIRSSWSRCVAPLSLRSCAIMDQINKPVIFVLQCISRVVAAIRLC